MVDAQTGYWLTTLTATVGGLWAVWTFLIQQRRDQAWRRTTFVIEQSWLFDNDPDIQESLKIVYGSHPKYTVDDVLEVATRKTAKTEDEAALQLRFEKLLNFLWRIAYANVQLKTLTNKDLNAFGAYFGAVAAHPNLARYCQDFGYKEILIADKRIA